MSGPGVLEERYYSKRSDIALVDIPTHVNYIDNVCRGQKWAKHNGRARKERGR
jgi:hypothetical protein